MFGCVLRINLTLLHSDRVLLGISFRLPQGQGETWNRGCRDTLVCHNSVVWASRRVDVQGDGGNSGTRCFDEQHVVAPASRLLIPVKLSCWCFKYVGRYLQGSVNAFRGTSKFDNPRKRICIQRLGLTWDLISVFIAAPGLSSRYPSRATLLVIQTNRC